ncbi:MAG: metallophosphoesterase [Chloroflexota bacterium]
MKLTRRQFLAGLGATGIGTAVYAWQIEPRWVKVEPLPLPIRHLPDEMVGRTLVQISDMHISSRYDWSYQLPALREIADMQPDYVVYTGDFVSYAETFTDLSRVMGQVPLGTMGTVAILGNHDYGRGWQQPNVADTISQILHESNITVLRNEAQTVEGLQIAGLDDFWGTNYRPDFFAKLDFAQPTIALVHNPDVVDEPIWGDYDGWILAGHTHGGQVKPPFLPPPMLPVQNRRYTAGVFALPAQDGGENGRFLYINRGLGNLWPVRFNMRPEITLFTLSRA